MISHTGHHHSDSLTSGYCLLISHNLFDPFGEAGDKAVEIASSGKAAYAHQRFSEQIAGRNVSAGGANIDGDDVSLSGINIKERWFPSAPSSFSGGAFKD